MSYQIAQINIAMNDVPVQRFCFTRSGLCTILPVLVIAFLLIVPIRAISAQNTDALISDLDWSTDGQRVAVGIARWQERDRFGVGYPALDCEPVFGVYLVDAPTQTVEFIDLIVDCSPSTIDFNPTGTEIVYTTDTVYGAIDVGARMVRQQVTALIDYHSIVWHPNGDRILLTLSIGPGILAASLVEGFSSGISEPSFSDAVLPFLYSIWSPDGNQAASSAADGRIYVWQSGQVQQVFAQHSAPVRRFVWNAATNLIASGDDSGTIWVWNPLTGEPVMQLAGHTGAILDIDWRADGMQIVSTSLDNTMRVWDWPSGTSQVVTSGQLVSAVAYSTDGSELAYGGEITDPNNVQINIVPVSELVPTPSPTPTSTPAPTQAALQRVRLTSMCSANPAAYRVWRPCGRRLKIREYHCERTVGNCSRCRRLRTG